MTARVCLAGLALLGIYGAAESIRDRGMPTELARPELLLKELPITFGSWTGTDSRLDPEIFRAIGAKMAINRRYRDDRSIVDLHSAVFLSYGVRVLHPPELCYEGSGYTVANGETVPIETDGNGRHVARLLTLEVKESRVYCLYWYQLGAATFWDGDEQRRVVRGLSGQTIWPPMIKVMLQTGANSADEAQGRLKSLASSVYAWNKKYH
jgi:hypothetical protein